MPYLNIFARGAFGNYRQLLYDVTLNPAMGTYLDTANNDKHSGGASPNENYAREILQLFSIGLYKLNQDGTLRLDGPGSAYSDVRSEYDHIGGFDTHENQVTPQANLFSQIEPGNEIVL